MVRRTPRKVAIQMPAKIAHRLERDISKGPSFLPSGLCAFASCRGGVISSGSLSEAIESKGKVVGGYEFRL